MIPIKIEIRESIWTSLGREYRLTVTYSDGSQKTKWYVIHDTRQNLFHQIG